jgi:hypothetical protein
VRGSQWPSHSWLCVFSKSRSFNAGTERSNECGVSGKTYGKWN